MHRAVPYALALGLLLVAREGGAGVAADEREGRPAPALDLAAYFASGPFARAQSLVAAGDVRAAVESLRRQLRAAPDAPERPQARFLLGLSLIQLGEYEEAARVFDELSVTYPLLRDEHVFHRGLALYSWGSWLQAAAVLAEVDPAGPRGEEARRLRARALLSATDYERLARWLEEIERAEGPLDPELRFVLAQARHRMGDVLGAYRAWRELWFGAPVGHLAGRALVEMVPLKLGDRPILADAERRAIASLEARLRSGKEPDGVMAELERKLAGAPTAQSLRAEVAYARGRIASGAGRLAEAERHYARALELSPPERTELQAKVLLEQAGVADRLGQAARALQLHQTVAERFPERAEAEDARFHAAEQLLSARKYREAIAELEALLIVNPVTSYRPRALWGIGWAHFRLADYPRAQQFFGALVRMRLPADLEAATRYWLGRTEATLGRLDVASALFAEVVRAHPLSHYAALAEDQLAERLGHAAVAGVGAAAPSVDEPGATLPVEVREYARLGLRARAVAALGAYEEALRRARRPPEQALRELARAYDELGQNVEARRLREEIVREHPASLAHEELAAAWKRALPLKYEAELRRAAAEHGVPDALLFGLVRTESGFRPDAVSGMGAYGLAQLVLPTAQSVAAAAGLPRPTRATLLGDPGYNARLGAAYLRSLLDRYGGSEPLALAAYNAGPGALDAWLACRVRPLEGVGESVGVGAAPAPDELTEEIPVAETRAFVKTVLARARGYAKLYPRATEPEVPRAPSVDVGALTEPSDLPAPPKEIADLPRGSQVLRDVTRDPVAERMYGVSGALLAPD